MEVSNISNEAEEIETRIYKLSIVGYFRMMLRFIFGLIGLIIPVMIAGSLGYENYDYNYILLILFVLYCAYDFCNTISTKVIISDKGVYIKNGAFPWNSGYSGVDWRFLESAYFNQSFVSWTLNSYTIVLSRGRTKADDLSIRDIFKGKQAVEYINDCADKIGM